MSARPLPPLLAHPACRSDDLGPRGRRVLTAGVLVAHVAGAWGLLQMDAVRQAVAQAAPIMVDWIAPPAETPAPPPPPVPRPAPRPAQPPRRVIAAPAAAQMPTWTAPDPSPASPAPIAAVAAPTPPSPAAPPAPPAPPAPSAAPVAPRQLPSNAVQYLVPPLLVVPIASRRLNEQGTVWLRLVVDVNGLPLKVSLHQSSGFQRLDDQAMQAMRSARFKPYTEHGVALEWTALAPLAYELD